MKKMLALTVGFLVLGFAFAAAQDKTQTQEKAQVQTQVKAQTKAQARVQTKSELRLRNRTAFVDENGDGINDFARDADGDGIPNCQDPDWSRPLDGSGYKAQSKMGQGQKAGFGKSSFRTGVTSAARTSGTGVCDGTGPKGNAQRKGRR